MNKDLIYIFITILILLSACSPSESQISTAIAETELASPSDTPAPTFTFTPTSTFTITPSPIPTETLTPTPDVRVINEDPKSIYLTREDLPKEGKYYLGYSTPNRNYEVVSARGEVEGTKYLEKTGRVDGWIIDYYRGTIAARVSEFISLNPIIYKEANGPEYLLQERGGPCFPDIDYTFIRELDFGDQAYLCLKKVMQSSGKYYYTYYVQIALRNVYIGVYAGGIEDTFNEEWVVDVAYQQFQRLESFPLVDEVTFSP